MANTMKKLAAFCLVLASLLLVTISAAGFVPADASPVQPPSAASRALSTASFTLDGVTLELTTSFLSELSLAMSDPTSAIQAAVAVERQPLFTEFSIMAVPFGMSPPTEGLTMASPGGADGYRSALRAHRKAQSGSPQEGARIQLFGKDAIGSTSVVRLHVSGEDAVPVVVTEWVAEAGQRLWIVRASQELESRADPASLTLSSALSFPDTAINSHDLNQPSTSLTAAMRTRSKPADVVRLGAQDSDLPSPSWWDGECDTVYFLEQTGWSAYPLGAEYRGLQACGPRPSAFPYVQTWVDFGVGQYQLEWQCPEISKRFLYLAYGIPPYPANGNDMVTNYNGDLLEKVWNCTPGRAPWPDDVLSYGATSLYGHTSVVVASDVDSAGNGTIDVIEQNSSINGHRTHTVSEWCVQSYTDVIGWLHRPDWVVEYYGDESLDEPCASHSLAGRYLFEAWGEAAPAEGCPADHFSARFSRSVHVPGGEYTFGLGYDDGARLELDGETVIDGWGLSDQHYVALDLTPGLHEMSVEYYDRLGQAGLTFFWWGPGFELSRETQDSSQWYAEYWANPTLWWDPVVMARDGDGALDHRWTSGSPHHSLPTDHFGSRFRRTLPFDGGRWRFDLFADDGVRFWIDDQLIVDEWQPQRAWFTPIVTLADGDHALVVDHYENDGWADIQLGWEKMSDTTAPTGWVVSPTHGAMIEDCPVAIEAATGVDVGPIDRVEFHAHYGGRWHHLGDDHTSPYTYEWDCLPVTSRKASLMIHVWDDSGNEWVDADSPITVQLNHLKRVHLPLIMKRRPDDG